MTDRQEIIKQALEAMKKEWFTFRTRHGGLFKPMPLSKMEGSVIIYKWSQASDPQKLLDQSKSAIYKIARMEDDFLECIHDKMSTLPDRIYVTDIEGCVDPEIEDQKIPVDGIAWWERIAPVYDDPRMQEQCMHYIRERCGGVSMQRRNEADPGTMKINTVV
jgi:hypothetical protein